MKAFIEKEQIEWSIDEILWRGGVKFKFKIVIKQEGILVMQYAMKIINGKVGLTLSKRRPFEFT